MAQRLSELLGSRWPRRTTASAPRWQQAVAALRPGQVLLLENVRFHPEEEANDPEFARRLATLGDLYVNDAFGTAHRAHASTAASRVTCPRWPAS